MGMYIHGDYSAMDRELDRLADLPGPMGVMKLDITLGLATADVKANTHIDTSSLMQSVRGDSEVEKDVWEGTITAGGPSTGPKNPVNYAIYEKARGGEHDFFKGLAAFHETWQSQIKDILNP
jgi:hypothetical protein